MPGQESSGRFAQSLQKKVSSIYSPEQLEKLAKQTGFQERKGKLTPGMFVDTVVFKDLHGGSVSLNDHSVALLGEYGVDIKKQSLAERFDDKAVEFIRRLLERQLSSQMNSIISKKLLSDKLGHFTSIKVKDSTRFQIPAELKAYYPGNTGAASGAGVHIQFEFDLLGGKVHDLAVTHALRQDNTDAQETIDAIEPGSLIIRDLGYFSKDVLQQIDTKGGYFITRAQAGMNLYNAHTDEKLDFNCIYRKMKRNKLSILEIPVLSGNKLAMRLVVEVLPKEQVNRRLAKAEKEARKKGRHLTDEYKSRARLNLFLTNVPADWIPTHQVRETYQLRWQIELRFKAWKSFYNLHRIKKMQRHRFECYLYGTLLLLIINWEIAVNFFTILWEYTGKPLSVLKFYKATSQKTYQLKLAILEGGDKLIDYIKILYQVSYSKLLSEKRKGHIGSLQEILMATTKV